MVEEQFGGDHNRVDDISRLPISLIWNAVNYNFREGDDIIPMTKHSLLQRWDETMDRGALTEVEYLLMFG